MRRRELLRGSAGALALATGGRSLARRGRGRSNARQDAFEPLGRVQVPGAKEAVVGADGTTVYLATTDGFAVVDAADPADPGVLAERRGLFADRENGPLDGIQDVKVDDGLLVVVGPANPLREDELRGMGVYDVSDPANPELWGFHETAYPVHNAFLDDGVAYLTGNDGDRNALVMLDPGVESEPLGTWSLVDHDEGWQELSGALRSLHDVWVQDGVAYVAHWDAGTWIVDVSDPSDPSVIGHVGDYDLADLREVPEESVSTESFQLPGNAHYVRTNDDASLLAVGREAWDMAAGDDRDGGPGGIDLYDLADPSAPERVGHVEPPPTPDPSLRGLWTTSHNFDLVGDRLYTSWYRGGVKLFDVGDPSSPEELAWWREPNRTEFWTAKKVASGFVAPSRRDPGRGASAAGLYVFPDRAGEQPDPPPLNTTAPNSTDPGTGTGLNISSPTTTTTTAPTTATTTGTSTTTTGGQPGFGLGVAAMGLGLGAWRYLRGC